MPARLCLRHSLPRAYGIGTVWQRFQGLKGARVSEFVDAQMHMRQSIHTDRGCFRKNNSNRSANTVLAREA